MAACVLASACRGAGGDDPEVVEVLAASSLTDVFEALGEAWGEPVAFSFGGSSTLARQIREGAPADAFAAADSASMIDIGEREPEVFATNRVAILVPEGNPDGIAEIGHLVGRRLALCAPQVPCGRYAASAFALAGVEVPEASQEENVRGVVQKVVAGEADAGIGYATDGGDGVDAVPLPIVTSYPIVAVDDEGEAFVDFVLSDEGQGVLEAHGFGRAP